MDHDFVRDHFQDVLDTDEADRLLADLADLMFRVSSPLLRAILVETAEEIKELLNDSSEEQTRVDGPETGSA